MTSINKQNRAISVGRDSSESFEDILQLLYESILAERSLDSQTLRQATKNMLDIAAKILKVYGWRNPQELSEDVVQECWHKLLVNKFRAYDGLRPLSVYVATAIWYECVNLHRARLRRIECQSLDFDPGDARFNPLKFDGADDKHDRVRSAVRWLPAKQREAITLQYWEGLSIHEIAQRSERTPGAVRSDLARGRKALELWLADLP